MKLLNEISRIKSLIFSVKNKLVIEEGSETSVISNISELNKLVLGLGLTNKNARIGLVCVLGKESGFQIIRETTKYLQGCDTNCLRRTFSCLSSYKDARLIELKKPENEFWFYVSAYSPKCQVGKDLGNIYYRDGYDYRGGGYNQLTGRKYYELLGVTPQEIETPAGAAKALTNSVKLYIGSKPSGLSFKSPEDALVYWVNKVRGGASTQSVEYSKAVRYLPLVKSVINQ